MDQTRGIEYFRRKLNLKRDRVLTRYKYYEMKNAVDDLNYSAIPNEFKTFTVSLGWCAKAVDCIADRLSFEGFKNDNLNLNEIYNMNNPDILTNSGNLSALITSCCFIYISKDATGYPRLQIIDGGNATGEIEPITHMLKEGYAVLSRDKNGNPIEEAHFIKGYTIYYEGGRISAAVANNAPYPLLVPIINRPDAVRPFGHSQISRACISILQSALRTLKRVDITSEFYSFPQKYILGMKDNAEWDGAAATLASFLNITKDEDGDKPTIGQFQQQSMAPFVEEIRMNAALFSGETGLTLDDLGFPSDNPSSSEAIKASHETLRLKARKAQDNFGVGYLNAGYLAACLRDDYAYSRQILYLTKPLWKPLFEPDTSTLSTLGDSLIKINQAVPGTITRGLIKEVTGLDIEVEDVSDIQQLEESGAFD